MTEGTAENVSLRFPSRDTEGIFDGNDKKSEPFAYLTRRDEDEPPIPQPTIPQPPKSELELALSQGVDKETGLMTQPAWLSVLEKRLGPWLLVRWLFCNCFCQPRLTVTRAQFIWFVNVFCLAVHITYLVRILEKTNGRGSDFEATVWRIRGVPNANATTTAVLIDNLKPIRLDFVVAFYFGFSVFMHALTVLLGPFDRWVWVYWRQLDLCFNWWRWLDQIITFPLIMMTLCCVIELREQNTIASIWMLMFCSIGGSFVTELWSRPHRNADRSYDMSRWLGDESAIKPGTPTRRLEPFDRFQRAIYRYRRRVNYVIRMTPHVFGIFPFVAMWTIVLNHFYVFLVDNRINQTDDIHKRIHDFVPILVIGTLVFQILLMFPFWYWQWSPPANYWKTEVVCPLLSLGLKSFVGSLMLDNVFGNDGGLRAALAFA